MKTLRPFLFLFSALALLLPACVVRPGRVAPHVAVGPAGAGVGAAGVTVGVYDRLPPGYTAPYYHYGNRYYYGGRWETGRFLHRGRYYPGRYWHGGRYFYTGRFHPGRR